MHGRRNLFIIIVGGGLLACFGLYILFFDAIPNYLKAQELAATCRPVAARLMDGNLRGPYVRYSYIVDNQAYTGSDLLALTKGDLGMISVTYLPDDPSFSAAYPPGQACGCKIRTRRHHLLGPVRDRILRVCRGAMVKAALID